MKQRFTLIALVCALAAPAFADPDKDDKKPKKETTATASVVTQKANKILKQKLSLNGQLNLGQVTAKITKQASITGVEAADAAVTAAAIGNALSSELDVAVQQANLAPVLASLSGDIQDATATAAAIGNSATLNLAGASGPNTNLGQYNSGSVVALINGAVSNTSAVTAAAIGNSLSITNAVID